jgi:hypothetical protein
MREVRIKVPEGEALRVVHLLQSLRVERVGVSREFVHGPDHWEEVVSTETSTPDAARIVQAIEEAHAFDPKTHTITIRELRAILTSEPVGSVTRPMQVPRPDLHQDLWQFSHVTYGHLLRVMVAASLISYAMIEDSLLLLVGGLLFLPTLPHLLAIGLGGQSRERRLAAQGAFALSISVAVLVACSASVAVLVPTPMKFAAFLPPAVSACVSVGIGIAGALASLDDVGKRELIGLATAAQVGLVPAWLGIGLVHGFDTPPGPRLCSFAVNLSLIAVTSAITYRAVRLRSR